MKFRPPKILRRIYPSFVWDFHSEANKDTVFITFDDGPTEKITYWILDTLDKYDAKATFFCLGKNVEQYGDQHREMLRRGHVVGNHSYSHIKGWGQSVGDYIEDVDFANDLIGSNLFRPPYGRISRSQARRVAERYNIIMWDVLSRDYSRYVFPKRCLHNVIDNIQGGSIVVFHDSAKSERNMKYALPKVLEHLRKRGYKCQSIVL